MLTFTLTLQQRKVPYGVSKLLDSFSFSFVSFLSNTYISFKYGAGMNRLLSLYFPEIYTIYFVKLGLKLYDIKLVSPLAATEMS